MPGRPPASPDRRSETALVAVGGGALVTGDFVTTCLLYAVGETACYAACLVAVLREAGRLDAEAGVPSSAAVTSRAEPT